MTEHLALSQQTARNVLKQMDTNPFLYLSSVDAGWEGLRAEVYREPAQLKGWMTPERSDIVLILSAGGAMRVEQRYTQGPWKAFSLHQGDLVLRPVGIPHELCKQSLSRQPTQALHLHLGQNLFARTAEEVAGHDPTRLSLVERFGFEDPLLAQIGFALWRELEQRAPAGNVYAQTAAQMLAIHLLRHYTTRGAPIEEPKGQLTDQQMRRVVDFVQAHLDQNLSLEALARQTGFSPYYFARLFRQTTGASPHQFVLRQRVERAQLLLKEREVSLAQVATACGFTDQSHLTQIFKRHVGLTPRAYQRDCFI
jgi:AraC family transcriptional regulator